ncbi:ribonuclease Z [Cognatitamlana onchidii]|uniref:ribonuclease Z n=1 Tax=Cognatitamlana onchidii TaxID=2562860 RepID=UPI0010A686C7|nr:ribonuclease Z [Algibacter onchidii]
MILDQTGNTNTITQEKASIIELVKKIQTLYPKFKNSNIIVSLNTLGTFSEQDIAEFLALSKEHKEANNSFVIVTSKVDFNLVPDDIVVVPTLQEAHDIIEMEDMERDLGF